MKKTLLMTDIDGVITDAKGRLDSRAVATIRDLEENGIPVGMISGRPFPMVLMLGEFLGVRGPLIAENGGIGISQGVSFQLGSRDAIEELVREVSGRIKLASSWDNTWRVTDFAFDRPAELGAADQVLKLYESEIEIQVSSIMVHFAKKGVTKGVALEHWVQHIGEYQGDIVVAGDSDSDLSMFDRFPHSIAPGSATHSIKNKAFYCAKRLFAEGFLEGVKALQSMGMLR